MIGFDIFASVSFSIAGSLALYMAVQFILFMMSTFSTIDESETLRPARR